MLDQADRATAAPSPYARRLKPPSWLDGRLVLGVVLVLVSVVVGIKVVSSADRYERVWVVSHDLAPGSVLGHDDLTVARVRFHDHGGGYVSADGRSPTGLVLTRALDAGELLPRSAVASAADPYRLVTVPVGRMHMPKDTRSGTAVDVYLTPSSGGHTGTPQLVVAGVVVAGTVSEGSSFGGGGGTIGIVLQVPPAEVAAVVGAAQSGAVDLVRVPITFSPRPTP